MNSLTFIFNYYPQYLILLLAICVVLTFLRFVFWGTENDRTRKILHVVLFAISVIGFIVRAEFAPQRNYVFFDEQTNIEVAWMLQSHGVSGWCLIGSIDDCHLAEVSTNPAGYHTLLSFWFRIAGASEKSAYVFSAVIGSVSILASGYLAYSIFGSMGAAFFSALLLCFLPMHIKYSAATCLNIVSFLFLILFFITLDQAFKRKRRIDLLLHIAVSLFFINVRGENWLIAMFVYFMVVLGEIFRIREKQVSIRQLIKKTIGNFRKTDLIFALIVLLEIIPVLVLVNYIVSIEKTGWVVSSAGLVEKLQYQLPMNLHYWFSSYHTILLSIIGILGMFLFGRKNGYRVPLLWLALFIVLLFGYSSYESGLFSFHENDRFSMNLNLPMILWGGYGLAQISGIRIWRRSGVVITVLMLALIAASYGQTYQKLMQVKHPWDDEMRESRRIITDYFPSLPIVTISASYYTIMSGDQQIFYLNGTIMPGNYGGVILQTEGFPLISDKQSIFTPPKYTAYVSRFPGEAVMTGFFWDEKAPVLWELILNYYSLEECKHIQSQYFSFPVCHIKLRREYTDGIRSQLP